MKEKFIDRKFSDGSLALISRANEILADYDRQGLVLTLRQLYYQFVARGVIPNKQTEYKRLGSVINDARLAGLIDWGMMEDRTRTLRTITHWADPSAIIKAVAKQYKEDLWRGQRYRPEVWIEKDALVGVIERACRDMRVDYFACRGYASQSAQYEAGHRFRRYRDLGQTPLVFHFGDHDPSGIDMTRDNGDRLSMFALEGIDVRRLALNMEQVERYNPPPNPAKESDSRAGDYMSRFGNESWELDALEPSVIDRLIRDNVGALIQRAKWEEAERQERENRAALQATSDRWDEVRAMVTDNNDDQDEPTEEE